MNEYPGPARRRAKDDFSPERLEPFLAGLRGLPPEEVRKAKILYIRNAITDYRASRDATRAVADVMGSGCLAFPFFGFRRMQRRLMEASHRAQEERILNAMRAWQDDLAGEEFHFPP